MRVRLPMMIQDPSIARLDIGRLVEDWTMLDEAHYLDGPVSDRVAVIDLDPSTEAMAPPARYVPPTGNRRFGRYDVAKTDIASPAFIPVSAFATVFRTIYLYEQRQVLGRRIRWAFDAPQLLVVPRAGWLANAYYERRSHSLQFFQFEADGQVVQTSLSRDIVAHETGHALIDGIDPDIYDALDPQALALHEGVADLTAMLLAFSSSNLTEAVLNKTGGSIRESTAFSSIGEQFGRAIDPDHTAGYLRSLLNDATLPADPDDEPEEHELSQVISGVLYAFVVALHEHFKPDVAARLGITEFSASGRALAIAAALFQRMVLRGLDYLPPGEITFADFGRAILAADQASYPDDTWRQWLRSNFVQRGIARRVSELDVATNVANAAVAAVDLKGLLDSQWVAYTFAERNRALLGIPAEAEFEVLPRVVVDGRFETPAATMDRTTTERRPADGDGPAASDSGAPFRELLVKIRWSVVEPNPPDLGATFRRVQTGTTLVIDWNARQIRSLLRPIAFEERRRARDRMMRRLVEGGLIEVSEPPGIPTPPPAPGARPTATGIDAVVTDGILRVRNTARLLHVVREVDRERRVTDLVVRVYDVRFGDAILVSIPDEENGQPVDRTILFDFGNALGTAGGLDTALDPVVDDILDRLGGRPLDLYVMTHEHLDHVQGALYASQRLGKHLKARQVWLTGSADPAYYTTHPDARKQKIAALAAYDVTVRRLEGLEASPFIEVLMANNNPSKTGDCVRFLREQVAAPADVHFVDRTMDLGPFNPDLGDASVTLWAPEEDTADYYGSFKGLAAGLGIDDTAELDSADGGRLVAQPDPIPPAGVDAGAFYNLLDVRHASAGTLLSIDRAANNTSVVTLLEWHGWRLLFAGDAEQRSWRTIDSRVGVGPVHFLKVSHHGSHTGTPPDDILDKLIPSPAPAGHRARAAVSTYPNTYPGVPDTDTLAELKVRLDLRSTRDLAPGQLFVEIRFDEAGPPP